MRGVTAARSIAVTFLAAGLGLTMLASGQGLTMLASGQGLALPAGGQTAAAAAGPSRAELKAEEKLCDKEIATLAIDTIEQITHARALYIEGYGMLITFEVNLSWVSPMVGLAGGLSNAQKERIRENKVKRLPEFRHFLEGLALEAVKPLEHLAPEEHLLVHVDFDYSPYENRDGLPDSISISAKKKDLLEAAEHKTPREQLEGVLKVKME